MAYCKVTHEFEYPEPTPKHMAKPIIITIKKGKHKTQPYTFDIDRTGPAKGETKKERYTTPFSAKRGALRMLGANFRDEVIKGKPVKQWYSDQGIPIVFK